MRRRAERRPELIARHSIRDAALRAQTLAHLEAGPLMRALFMSTNDRVAERLPGTLNDMRQLAGISSYLLRSISTPTLVVHGTADRAVSLAHAEAVAQQVTGSEFFPIADGEHVALFTHLDVIRERVGAFMSEQSESDGSMPAHSDWARLRTY